MRAREREKDQILEMNIALKVDCAFLMLCRLLGLLCCFILCVKIDR